MGSVKYAVLGKKCSYEGARLQNAMDELSDDHDRDEQHERRRFWE